MKSKDAEQIARQKLKEYLEQHKDAVDVIRGREIFMFGPEGSTWVGIVGVFMTEAIERASLKHGWLDRPEDRAKEWLRVTVFDDGTTQIEEVVDWRTL
jgi:hypothetical protein